MSSLKPPEGTAPSGALRSDTPKPRAAPRRAWLRFGLLIALLLTGMILVRWSPLREYVDVERAVGALEALRRNPLAPALVIGAWAAAAPFGLPVSPLVFASGAVFGTFWGWVYSLIGATISCMISFWVARGLGHDLIARRLGEARLAKVEKLVGRHGFWTVCRLRFAPLPFALVNTGAALAGMRFPSFLAGSVLGLAPSYWVYNYFSHSLVAATEGERGTVVRNLVIALAAFLALTLLPQILTRLRKRSDSNDAPR